VALAILTQAGRAEAGPNEEARAYSDKATAAFALAKYAVAAENFEKAFELKPDPALLYNAAQAHRLAGNKDRALVLYKNYLRVYAKQDKRAEIEARIDEIEKAIAHDKAVETKPPNSTEPFAAGPPAGNTAPPPPAPAPAAPPPAETPPSSQIVAVPPPPPPAAPAATETTPTLVAQPPPSARDDDSLFKKPWFWIATGGGVAVAVTVILLLTMGGSKDPSPNIGRINGN
jgi:tetratricopeptide (TPR) repeat protein